MASEDDDKAGEGWSTAARDLHSSARHHHGELTEIVSCVAPGGIIRSTGRGRFEGLYHVCGKHPWLYVRRFGFEGSPPVDLHFDMRGIRTGLVTWALKSHDWPASSKAVPLGSSQVQAFIFLRPFFAGEPCVDAGTLKSQREAAYVSILDVLAEPRLGLETRRIVEPVASEWWFVAEIVVRDLTSLAPVVRAFLERNLDTSTKCVLVRWIDRGDDRYYEDNLRRKRDFVSAPSPSISHKSLMVVRNNRRFFHRKSLDQQESDLQNQVFHGIQPRRDEKLVDFRSQLEHRLGSSAQVAVQRRMIG